MMRFSTEIRSEPVDSIEDTVGVVLRGEELRGFVPDKLLKPFPLVDADTGTVIRVISLEDEVWESVMRGEQQNAVGRPVSLREIGAKVDTIVTVMWLMVVVVLGLGIATILHIVR